VTALRVAGLGLHGEQLALARAPASNQWERASGNDARGLALAVVDDRSLPAFELTHQGRHLLVQGPFHVAVVRPVTRYELLQKATERRGGQVRVEDHDSVLVCHPVASSGLQPSDITPGLMELTAGRDRVTRIVVAPLSRSRARARRGALRRGRGPAPARGAPRRRAPEGGPGHRSRAGRWEGGIDR